ncbi:MAG TPA: hypothetical protein PKN95_06840 [Verrucomicrobiota bacterium]|nr:hypothetical protein [Verrucomicrobiota bacterium]HNT13379.1 hypothetical protein [Verrucomicrobiota bacterium]
MKNGALLFAAVLAVWCGSTGGRAATTNLFSTGFEAAEGYSTDQDLAGQQNWQSEGSGGNGIIPGALQEQSAYIGFSPPEPADASLVLWQPINFAPLTAGRPLVKFRVLVNISDSSNGEYDIFRWSVYNHQVNRLFSIDLDNLYLDVSYRLDGTNATVFTSIPFVNNSNYLLTVTMDFAANRWSATWNDAIIATNQPLTTTNAPLTLGDIDAIWLFNRTAITNSQGQIEYVNAPGDNYMLFDNYQITAEALPPPQAQLQLLGRTAAGWGLLRVLGRTGDRWAVEATTDFTAWSPLKTNIISDGSFDAVDTHSGSLDRRFYRARFVP